LRESHVGGLEPAAPFDPHGLGPAHHDLLDGWVLQERLERAEPKRPLGDAAGELGAGVGVEHRRLAIDERLDAAGQVLGLGVAGAGQEAVAEVGGELVEVLHRG
jgi:hypothetical protein